MRKRMVLTAGIAAAMVLISSDLFRAQSLDCQIWSTTSMMWQARLALTQARNRRVVNTKLDCLALGSRLAGRIGIPADPGEAFCGCVCDAEFDLPGPGWRLLPGSARDIAARGTEVWIVGSNPAAGGFGTYRWNGTSWITVPGGAVAIALDETMQPWIVNERGGIYRRNGANWIMMPGAALDIGAGTSGTWVVGTNPVPGGFGVFRWAGTGWAPVPAGAVRITVDQEGAAWVVSDKSGIYRWNGTSWIAMPGSAIDIGAGPAGVWIVGVNPVPGGFGIYRWDGSNWVAMPGGGLRIAVGNEPWVVNDQQLIWSWR